MVRAGSWLAGWCPNTCCRKEGGTELSSLELEAQTKCASGEQDVEPGQQTALLEPEGNTEEVVQEVQSSAAVQGNEVEYGRIRGK